MSFFQQKQASVPGLISKNLPGCYVSCIPVHAWQQTHCAWPKNPEEGTDGEMDCFVVLLKYL